MSTKGIIQRETKPIRLWVQNCSPGCPAQRSLPSAPSQGVTCAGPRLGVGAAPRQSGQEIADLAKGEAVVQRLQWVDAGHHGAAFKPCRPNTAASVSGSLDHPACFHSNYPKCHQQQLRASQAEDADTHTPRQSRRAAELTASPSHWGLRGCICSTSSRLPGPIIWGGCYRAATFWDRNPWTVQLGKAPVCRCPQACPERLCCVKAQVSFTDLVYIRAVSIALCHFSVLC